MNLIIIRGLPGSGKSTMAKEFVGYKHFEADDFFTNSEGVYKFDGTKIGQAHVACQENVKQALENNCNVVVSNTFVKVWEMEPYLQLAKQFSSTVFIMEARGKFKNVHGVPEEMMQKMMARWERI